MLVVLCEDDGERAVMRLTLTVSSRQFLFDEEPVLLF